VDRSVDDPQARWNRENAGEEHVLALPCRSDPFPPEEGPRQLSDTRRKLLLACLGLALSTQACSGGATDADVDRLRSEMSSAFHQRGQKVVRFQISKDSRFQVSGMIFVDIESPTGTRSFYTTCLATMSEASRKWDWKCDGLP